jgi:membrane-bound serine protease (ClpP class)
MRNLIKFFLTFCIFMPVFSASSFAEYIIVPIKGTIDGGIAAFVQRAVEDAEKRKAEGLIFQIDTPGGRIDSAVLIKDTILKTKIPTIAFVDKNAISAGALISIACDKIYMSTGSSIGAATAVDMEGKKASEKIISYFRAQMRATAESNGRRPDIAQAMVDEQLAIDSLTVKGQLVTLTYSEAIKWGYSDGTVETIGGVLTKIGRPTAQAEEYKMNWSEFVVRFLTNPIVSSLLMSIGVIGLIVELKAPGWGIGGTIALIALALFFGSHYIVKLAGIAEILLLVAGVILVTFEIFVIPGFGLPGVLGIALILLSFFLSLVGSIPRPQDYTLALYTVGSSVLIISVSGYFVLKTLHGGRLFRSITLPYEEKAVEGYTSAKTFDELLGTKGVALSTLRPAGKAEFDGKRYDVVTEGGYIEKGAAIEVVEIDGARIVVKES